jgi:DNA polymerase III subunit gamma/tau
MSWHRIYRPKTIKGLHLSNIRETLQGFMDKGQIPQVMLFAGPKGTGKTSSARIIGAMLNDPQNEKIIDHQFFNGSKPKKVVYLEPDEKRSFNDRIYRGQSFIVQEMDAASNRGIDDVRDLKERVALPPQDGKMTVYILDEAHMLTTAAFNALLKLLEEPPAHAVFILATTELHKIPETIKSRCSILHFRKATHEEIKTALVWVLKEEKIKFQEEALDLICELADGSFRDAVKLLEMVATDGQVTVEKVELVLSASVNNDVIQLLVFILDKDEKAVMDLFEDLRSRNIDEQFFFKSVLNYLHTCLLQNLEIKAGKPFTSQAISLFLLKELSQTELTSPPISHLHLELKVLDLIARATDKGKGGVAKTIPQKSTPSISKKNAEPKVEKKAVEIPVQKKILNPNKDEVAEEGPAGDSQKLLENWSSFLSAVKKQNITIEALLRSAKPIKGVNGTAEVQVFYKFHKEQLELPKFRTLILDCAAPIAGGRVRIDYQLSETPPKAELVESDKTNDLAALAEEVLV